MSQARPTVTAGLKKGGTSNSRSRTCEHEERYRELAANLKDGKVFAREEQQVWICRNCGYTYIGKSAPMKCPVCAHPQSFFELKKHNY